MGVDAAKAPARVRLALKKMVDSKALVAAAAAGKKGAGSFTLLPRNQRQRSLLPRNQKLRSHLPRNQRRLQRNQQLRSQRLPRSLLLRNQQQRNQLPRSLQLRSLPRRLHQRRSK